MQGGAEEESLPLYPAAERTNRTAASGWNGCAEAVELRNDLQEEDWRLPLTRWGGRRVCARGVGGGKHYAMGPWTAPL